MVRAKKTTANNEVEKMDVDMNDAVASGGEINRGEVCLLYFQHELIHYVGERTN